MITLNAHATVGDWVRDRPDRSRVLERLGIDYCCGGKRPLAEACRERGLDVETVVDQLIEPDDAATGDVTDADALSLTDLADHIEQTHHAYLRRELPRLGAMVRKVAAVHGERCPWMLELDGVFAGFVAELDSHMMKEEQILFPLIRDLEANGSGPDASRAMSVGNPIRVMEHEHDDAGRALERMRTLSNGFAPPADACNTFRAMLDGLAQLEQDMHQHVHKENNVLFPKAIELEARLAAKGGS